MYLLWKTAVSWRERNRSWQNLISTTKNGFSIYEKGGAFEDPDALKREFLVVNNKDIIKPYSLGEKDIVRFSGLREYLQNPDIVDTFLTDADLEVLGLSPTKIIKCDSNVTLEVRKKHNL